jgi:hypothetical protein
MANTIQLKRGVEADRSSVTPASGEMLYTTDTKLVYIGDGTTAGGNPVGVGGGNAVEATASGSLANGDMVVVNSDGTVSVVASITQAIGSEAVFESATILYSAATYDASNDRVVIAYMDSGNSNYGTSVVGTISGTSITFGTPVVFESAYSDWIAATYDPVNEKVVVAYRDNGNSGYGTAIVGTVSGTSISFGSAAVFYSADSTYNAAVYDAVNGKIIVAGYWNGDGRAAVGTVSGSSITFGAAVSFTTNNVQRVSAAYDSGNSKVVIAYSDANASYSLKAVVGTVSGTSISFGTPVQFEAGTGSVSYGTSTVYDQASGKVVIAYPDNSNSYYGTAVVGTVSGTSISFGSAVIFESAGTSYMVATYSAAVSKTVISYADDGNSSYGTIVTGTVSGTSISFSSPVVFNTAGSYFSSITYDSTSQKIVVAYRDAGNSNYGTGIVFQPAGSNLTATNFIGVSDGAYADTATATIQTKGAIDDAQTGLTAGQAYYVQADGSLSTTAGTPSVFAGTAVSSTNIIVRG